MLTLNQLNVIRCQHLKKVIIIWIFVFFAGTYTQAQDTYVVKTLSVFQNSLERQLLTQFENQPFFILQSLNTGANIYHDKWEDLIDQLDQLAKEKKSNVHLLSNIFFHTHSSLLENYTTFASFSHTLSTGDYDCVTGTAVMGLLLDRYGITYKIIELQGHVYIKGWMGKKPFIIESTDPWNGLLVGNRRVSNWEKKITEDGASLFSSANERVGQRTNINKQVKIAEIGLKELGGLQYYNDAVRKFEDGAYEDAYVQLIKGELLYPSSRITQFKQQLEFLIIN